MNTLQIVLLIVGIVAVLFLTGSVFAVFFASYQVYTHTLVRKPGKWGRQISEENPELQAMWDAGVEWSKRDEKYLKVLTIKSRDGLKLVAEFYDYGYDTTSIIMPGRRECCMYSYYYAMAYKNAGSNVLVVDQRAHGLSEGKYATAGILEALDVIDWCNELHENHRQNTVILHGICVGTCCTVNILRNPECPTFIKGVIMDSVFIDYKEIFGRHMMEEGHKLGLTFKAIWFWFKKCTGCNIEESAPLKYIDIVQLPACFIWGKKDVYCLPEKSEIIWQKCTSQRKEVHWFENGTHSKLRLSDPNKYDEIFKIKETKE